MFTIRIADLNVRIDNRYDLILEKCQSYLVSDSAQADLTVKAAEEDIQKHQAYSLAQEGKAISEAEAEHDCIQYLFYPELSRFHAFWLHACVVAMDGQAYAFSAPPGTGKTTHGLAWLKRFPEKARILNGDNPIIRKKDGVFTAFGTPFCGKEGFNENRSVPLKGLCFLRRAESNRIERLDPVWAMIRMYRGNWCIREQGEACQESHLVLYHEFVEQIPVYTFHMNNYLPDAVTVAYEGMQGGEIRI